MAKDIKKAERELIDAGPFPLESMRERLARKYGLDAVCLSGPCEGQPLVECIVDQLKKRWDTIQSRFAGNNNKINKLAFNLAESYMQKDDTEECLNELRALGYTKSAANGITSYLKAYALDMAATDNMNAAMDHVDAGPDSGMDMGQPSPETPDMGAPAEMGGGELEGPPEMATEAPEMGGDPMAPDMDGDFDGGAGETVTIELPKEVAEQVADAVQVATGGDGMDEGMGEGMDLDNEMGSPDLGLESEDPMGEEGNPGLDLEVVDTGDDVPSDDVVPGEPSGGMGEHEVEGHGAEHDACPSCGQAKASEGHHDAPEKSAIQKLEEGVLELKNQSGDSAPAPEKKEHSFESKSEDKGEKHESHDNAEKEENKEFGEKVYDEKEAKAARNMRSGHISKVAAESVLKLGPEMKLNNTDQIGPHEGKELGKAKEKSPEEPKPMSEGNVALEGYSAGGNKFQDGKTMGHEQAFDAKPFDKGSATGGKGSLMGKDESYPEGKPSVPAGSAPIGGEVWTGGDLATKGTVIATITPNGIVVEANGKKFLAKGTIKQPMVAKLEAGLNKLAFNGNAHDFAKTAYALIKEAEKSGEVDNVTKIDTSKLEGSTFTNDADKKPDEGGAMTGKGKGGDYQNKDVTKTDTSKKEANDFQNDADKKPEDEGKKASATKEVKTAKPIEDPKPIEDNMKPEGFVAGGDKVQDGSTMGHEQKFDAKTIDKSEVSKGSASEMGKSEEFPTGKADVPAGGGKMGHEQFDGGNVSTKGTTIADQSQKRNVEAEIEALKNAHKVEMARLVSAAVYVADLLRSGEVSDEDFSKELTKVASFSVPAIQNLIASTKMARKRVAARAEQVQKSEGNTKVAGLSIPIVVTASKNEMSLKEELVKQFKLTKTLDSIDDMIK